MSRSRFGIVIAVLVVFAVVGAYLLFSTKGAGPQDVTFNVTVTGGAKMQPDRLPAHQNDMGTINVTSDTDGEGHLHGYDIPFDTKAGPGVSPPFQAANNGGLPIEGE